MGKKHSHPRGLLGKQHHMKASFQPEEKDTEIEDGGDLLIIDHEI